jgi:hypothetical protein
LIADVHGAQEEVGTLEIGFTALRATGGDRRVDARARVGLAEIRRALIAVTTVLVLTTTASLAALIVGGARVAVFAVSFLGYSAAVTRLGGTAILGAGVPVRTWNRDVAASSVSALVRGAGVHVITIGVRGTRSLACGIRRVGAATAGIAKIEGAGIRIIASERFTARALSITAEIARSTGVAVVTQQSRGEEWIMNAGAVDT